MRGRQPKPPPPHFLHIHYDPSVACTAGCAWLMHSLCMAHIWPQLARSCINVCSCVFACTHEFVQACARMCIVCRLVCEHTQVLLFNVYRSQVTDHQPLIWPYMDNTCAICRSYIGHILAIHKLYISHVQPTVQATDGPY